MSTYWHLAKYLGEFAWFTIHVMMKKDDNIEGTEQDNFNHKYVIFGTHSSIYLIRLWTDKQYVLLVIESIIIENDQPPLMW